MTQTNKKIVFISLFALVGFGLMQIPFTKIIGSSLKFSLFDFYGPIAAGFVGSAWGVATVLIMQITNWAIHGFSMDTSTLIRLLPMVFAAIYFSKKSAFNLAVPMIAMLAFWLHPEGQKAWYYALYWLIPMVMYVFHDRFIFARALGTTFTAHAVGSALWIWTIPMSATVWTSLIPVVWKERGLMAIGITLTFMATNYILATLNKKYHWLDFVQLHKKSLLGIK